MIIESKILVSLGDFIGAKSVLDEYFATYGNKEDSYNDGLEIYKKILSSEAYKKEVEMARQAEEKRKKDEAESRHHEIAELILDGSSYVVDLENGFVKISSQLDYKNICEIGFSMENIVQDYGSPAQKYSGTVKVLYSSFKNKPMYDDNYLDETSTKRKFYCATGDSLIVLCFNKREQRSRLKSLMKIQSEYCSGIGR